MTSKLIEIISRCNQLLDFMDRYNLTGLLSATEEQLREYVKEEYGLENTKEIEDRWRYLQCRADEKPYARKCQLIHFVRRNTDMGVDYTILSKPSSVKFD